MTTQEILNAKTTKTAKIKQLLACGLTRTQVTTLIAEHYQTPANYGFVQNVYTAMKEEIKSKKDNLIITDTTIKSNVPLFTGEELIAKKIILLPY
jgi:hypothetical protein